MFNCLICNKNFNSKKSLFTYHLKSHKITSKQYKEKFNLIGYCEICRKEINIENKTKRCNSCRDRNGINNPFFNKHHSSKTKETLSIKSNKNNKIKWTQDEYRSKVIKGISKPRKEGFKEEQSKRTFIWWKNHPEQKEKISISMKNNWSQGLITKNNYSSNTSNLEKNFLKELKLINESFKKGTLKINKRWFFPDVIDEKRKLIIEYFGDFYHCNPKIYSEDYFNPKIKKTAREIWELDEIRIKIFINNGYNVIIIWEKDFKENSADIINQIKLLVQN